MALYFKALSFNFLCLFLLAVQLRSSAVEAAGGDKNLVLGHRHVRDADTMPCSDNEDASCKNIKCGADKCSQVKVTFMNINTPTITPYCKCTEAVPAAAMDVDASNCTEASAAKPGKDADAYDVDSYNCFQKCAEVTSENPDTYSAFYCIPDDDPPFCACSLSQKGKPDGSGPANEQTTDELVETVKEVLTTLVTAVTTLISDIVNAVVTLVTTLADELPKLLDNVVGSVTGLLDKVTDAKDSKK